MAPKIPDFSKNNAFVNACADLIKARADMKAAKKAEEAAKKAIEETMGSNTMATAKQYVVNITDEADFEGNLITKDMIGQRYGARKGAHKITVNENTR